MLELPPLRYLAVDGSGDPNTAASYREALETLYPVAFHLKFFSKRELGRDYGVMPLEGLWWSDDMATFTDARDKSRWNWTMLILLPPWLTDDQVATSRSAVGAKAPAPDRLYVLALHEGLVVQTLHLGPYDDEGPLLAELHAQIIPARGLRMTGLHHEIYLGDPRRTSPERLRTILRQPVARR